MWVQRLELWQPFWTMWYIWKWKAQTGKVELQAQGAWGTNHLMKSHNIIGLPASRFVLNEREMNLYSCLRLILLGTFGYTKSDNSY